MKDVLKFVVFAGLFAVPFLTLYVENDYFFPFITGKNFWFRILVDVTFAAWIVLAFYEVKYRPRMSGITWSFMALLVTMFFSNIMGAHPQSSFWSNFERMDGYVSLVHTFMYMFVLGSVLSTKKHWNALFNTSLGVAAAVAMYGLAQYGGMIDGANRIDSRLGNAAYMAIYMLFHIFLAFWLFVESRNNMLKFVYALAVVMFVFVLFQTGTRGTAIGLVAGVLTMSAYIAIFGVQFKQYRKYAVGLFLVLIAAVSIFVSARDTDVVQNSVALNRIANISLGDLEIRSIIWSGAINGIKERPLIGHGQSNFNYVFNENYDPRLFAQEQWFDRSHNIFIDWLVTGGIFGLVAYLSIFVWCAYYLIWRPWKDENDESFTVLERGVLLGILAGYFTHNLVVFDNIVSYIFFAIILGLITSRVGIIPKKIANFKTDDVVTTQIVAPVVAVILAVSIYLFHIPGMQAAGDVIDAFRAQDPVERLEKFQVALDRDSFANQEITEQLAQQTMSVINNQQIPEEVRQKYIAATERELIRLAEEKPGDARVYVFIGSYYRSIGQLDKSAEYLELARAESPLKQGIIHQQGFVEMAKGNNEKALGFFAEAFNLVKENLEAREYYAAALFSVDKSEEALALRLPESDEDVSDEAILRRFAASDFLIGTANQAGALEFVTELFEYRANPASTGRQNWAESPQTWATLAYLYYQQDKNEQAIAVLEESKEKLPAFSATADCFIANIEAGNDPQEGCQ